MALLSDDLLAQILYFGHRPKRNKTKLTVLPSIRISVWQQATPCRWSSNSCLAFWISNHVQPRFVCGFRLSIIKARIQTTKISQRSMHVAGQPSSANCAYNECVSRMSGASSCEYCTSWGSPIDPLTDSSCNFNPILDLSLYHFYTAMFASLPQRWTPSCFDILPISASTHLPSKLSCRFLTRPGWLPSSISATFAAANHHLSRRRFRHFPMNCACGFLFSRNRSLSDDPTFLRFVPARACHTELSPLLQGTGY